MGASRLSLVGTTIQAGGGGGQGWVGKKGLPKEKMVGFVF